jgi:hypothetical protein
MLLIFTSLMGWGAARTRPVLHPSPATRHTQEQPVMRARRWHSYWRRTLPLWGGVYLVTLLGVLSVGTYLNRLDADTPSQQDRHPLKGTFPDEP